MTHQIFTAHMCSLEMEIWIFILVAITILTNHMISIILSTHLPSIMAMIQQLMWDVEQSKEMENGSYNLEFNADILD